MPFDGECASEEARCFHCGEPNARDGAWRQVVSGVSRSFCCAGCAAIAQMIDGAGLADYYASRTAVAAPAAAGDEAWERYDVDGATQGLVVRLPDGACEVALLLEGIHCAACISLVEGYLARQAGVLEVHVNFATRRARIRWDPTRARLSDVLRAIAALGYRAYPYDPQRREALARRESRALLLRAALALLAMMQVMMLAVPAYVSADGVEAEYKALLDYASLLLTLPVVLYCAAPFFRGAWRDLRLRRPGMDVPVALGVGAAFVASAWTTLGGGDGAVFYDSVTMFVALLLCARWFELRARQKAGDALEAISRTVPDVAQRLVDYPASPVTRAVAAGALRAGDHVAVAEGAVIPADGEVVEGRSSVEEALLTGESWPRLRSVGDHVLAGSVNRESPIVVRVTAAGGATVAASLGRMVEQAANERPRVAVLADRVASRFIAVLLVLTALVACAWWLVDPSRVLPVTIAILVASCPCALSLATPAVIAAAAGALARRGIVVTRSGAVETLARVTHVVFDKTGTLTTGRLELTGIAATGRLDAARCLALAAALEHGSGHPIAHALRHRVANAPRAYDVIATPGSGVSGWVGGQRYRFGRPDWAASALDTSPLASAPADAIVVALADAAGVLAVLHFRDTVRAAARELIARLRARGLQVALMSGDREASVAHVASELGIRDHRGGMSPQDKRDCIALLQSEGAVVAMVGDGINDAPSLAQADVSLSLGSAATLTQWTSGIVVLGDDIGRIGDALAQARRALRIIRVNLAWALGYNLCVIPLAALGYLSPIVAALGMSASSMFVVANALRALSLRPTREPSETARPVAALQTACP